MPDAQYDAARRRVDADPDLLEHRDLLLHPWPDAEEHFEWVVTAPTSELLAWARPLKKNFDDLENLFDLEKYDV